TEGEHPAKRRAKAFSNVLDKMTIVIREDELLVGAMTRFLRGALPSVDTNPKALKAIMQQAEPQTASSPATEAVRGEEDRLRIIAACDYLMDRYAGKRGDAALDEAGGGLWPAMCESRMAMRTPASPQILPAGADYDQIMAVGYNGIIQEARDRIEQIRAEVSGKGVSDEQADSIEWLEAVIVAVEGVIRHAHRYTALARDLAEK